MAPSDSPKSKNRRKSRYTEDRGMPGAFEGETVTRRGAMTIGGQAVGGIAAAAFALPALGFALGPMLEDSSPDTWQDVGAEKDFNDEFYVPRVMNIVASIGEAGKTTVYMRKFNPKRDSLSPSDKENDKKPQPYVAISPAVPTWAARSGTSRPPSASSARATAGSTTSRARSPGARRCARSTASTPACARAAWRWATASP